MFTYFHTLTEAENVFNEQFENGLAPLPERHQQAGFFQSRLNETGFFALTLQRIGHQLIFLTALYEKTTTHQIKRAIQLEIEDIIQGKTVMGIGTHVGTKNYTFTNIPPTITGYTKNTSGLPDATEMINGAKTSYAYMSTPTVTNGVIDATLENYAKELGYLDGGFETDPGFGLLLVGYTNVLATPSLFSVLSAAIQSHIIEGAERMFQKLVVYYGQDPKFTEKNQTTTDFNWTHTTLARLAENYGCDDLQIIDTGISTVLPTTNGFKVGTGVLNTIYVQVGAIAYYATVGLRLSKNELKWIEQSEKVCHLQTNSPLRVGQLHQYFEQFPLYIQKIGNPTVDGQTLGLALGVGGVSQSFALTTQHVSPTRLAKLGACSVHALNSSNKKNGNSYYSQDHMRGFLGSSGYDSYVGMALVWLAYAAGDQTITNRFATAADLHGTAFTLANQIGQEYIRKLNNQTSCQPIAMMHASKSDDGTALFDWLGQVQNYAKDTTLTKENQLVRQFSKFMDRVHTDNPHPTGYLYSFACNGNSQLWQAIDARISKTGEFKTLNEPPRQLSAVHGYIRLSAKTSHRGIHGLASLLERGLFTNVVTNGWGK